MQNKIIKNIGWIGTGVMGKSMVGHLIRQGYNLQIYNRTQSKTDELVQQGAKFMLPQQIAEQSDIVFLMLGYPKDVEDMIFNKEKLINYLQPNSYLVDHTTSSPDLAKKIYQQCIQKNIHSLDAPVSGGDIGARDGKLAIMTGGDKQAFDTLYPILQSYGSNIKYLGQAGNGQHCKMVNQITIALNMMGVCESLLYGHKAGLDLNLVIDTISTGAAASFSLSKLGPRILNRDFEPGFFVEHFVKDMDIILDEAKRVNLSLPGLSLVRQFYEALLAQGGARNGTQALMLVLEKLNNINIDNIEKNN